MNMVFLVQRGPLPKTFKEASDRRIELRIRAVALTDEVETTEDKAQLALEIAYLTMTGYWDS